VDLTIHNAILDSTLKPINIGIKEGIIDVITENDIDPGNEVIEAQGAMVSPPFVDAHFHLENALLWEKPNNSGTLQEAIDLYAEIKKHLDTPSIVKRSLDTLRSALENGSMWMRCHVDIDHISKLKLLDGVVAARREAQSFFDIQLVAFPQWGLTKNPEAVDYMWQAMESGADVVGGMPHGEKDMDDAARHIEIAFEIAKSKNVDIDMHVDETDDPYWHSLELLAEKTIEENYQGRVSAGHCCAMGSWPDQLAARVIEKVKKAEITIIANIPINLLLEGRHDSHPFRRGIPRIKDLLDAGVNVALGQDDVNNMFYPFGKMDMLEVANFAAHAAHLSSPDQIQAAFDMPRYNAAKALRLKNYGIKVGAPANLILIDSNSAVDAIRRQPNRMYVIRNGQILVKSKREMIFSQAVL
jgi:cytosine/creatinine deaminase